MEALPSFPEPGYFFKRLEIANTGYGNSDHFRNPNLQYFEILLDKNIIFANCYVIFKNQHRSHMSLMDRCLTRLIEGTVR